MLTLNEYCRKNFGEKLYRISLNGGMTCPNRDGTCGTRGCIFCSEGGSGDFASDGRMPINLQIEEAKKKVAGKFHGSRYIAYFQAYTNTYAPTEYLRSLFFPVIRREDIAVLSIATRPDCLDDDVLSLIAELNEIKPVWIELGLQTIHPKTAEYIRRGYDLEVYDRAVEKLNGIGVHVVTHVILGLPGETEEDMVSTVKYAVAHKSNGIKLQLLHVLKNTDLAEEYQKGSFSVLTLDEYLSVLTKCVAVLAPETVVHRLTGDGPKKLLIAPLWSADKKNVLNRIHESLKNAGLVP